MSARVLIAALALAGLVSPAAAQDKAVPESSAPALAPSPAPAPTTARAPRGSARSVPSAASRLDVPLQVPAPAFERPGVPLPLPELIARALARDPQVRVAQAQLEATEQRLVQARSRYWPTVGLALVSGHSIDREAGLKLVDVDRRNEHSDATLRWNLYNAGNDQAEITAADRDILAAQEDLNRAREEVSERLIDTSLDLARVDQLLRASRERVLSVHALAQQARRQAELGRLAEADLQAAESSVLDNRLAHEQLQTERESVVLKLSALAGEDVAALVPLELPALPEEIPAEAVHAGIRAAKQRAQAARLRVRPAATLWAPKVDLDISRRLSDNTSPIQSTEQRQSWQVGVRWEFPLGGENTARLTEVERRAQAAEAEAQRQEQLMRAELNSLAPRLIQGERGIALLNRQLDQNAQVIRAGEVQFEAGRRTVQNLMQLRDSRYAVEQRIAEQRQRLAQTRLRQLSLTGQLLQALGLRVPSAVTSIAPLDPAAPTNPSFFSSQGNISQ